MEEIIITVQNGKAKIEVRGVKGQSCKALTKEFEDKLAGRKISDTPTKEMYEQPERLHARR